MTKIKGRHLQKRRTTQKSDDHADCFGKRLAEMRRGECLTQRELATFFGVTTDYLLGLAPINISLGLLQKDVCEGIQLSDLLRGVCNLEEKQLRGLALLLNTTAANSKGNQNQQKRAAT